LTIIVSETFDKKKAKGKQSIFLDVGTNIGWFSLVAAAHGATKIYSFESSLLNTVRFCESLSLNGWSSGDLITPVSKGAGNMEEVRKLYAISHNPSLYISFGWYGWYPHTGPWWRILTTSIPIFGITFFLSKQLCPCLLV
jgi:hypothetical protein